MDSNRDHRVAHLNDEMGSLDLAGRLNLIASRYPRAVFTTSLGMEDQVLLDAIARADVPLRIVTLQTGMLFPQTLEILDKSRAHYDLEIEIFRPTEIDEQDYINSYGKHGFYESIDARRACCQFRKLLPLKRALGSADAWITGLRRGQSGNRADIPMAEPSDDYGLMKFNPLADWSSDQMRSAISSGDIPVNSLHAQGFPSIGCETCTRAVRPGEPERAGRWWWETEQKRECGLHVTATQNAAVNYSPSDDLLER